jgi:hypothetical protein
MVKAARILSVVLIIHLSGSAMAQETAETLDNSNPAVTEQKPGEQDGSLWSQFIDKDDNHLDLSEFLIENAYGFLPVPLIITEPAIDNGLGMAGIFFHKPGPDDRKPEEGQFMLTDISAVAAVYTGNDSWMVGGAHFNTMREDTRRYTGTIGYADINLDFFGSEGNLPGPIEKVGFNAKGFFTDQKFEFRLGQSDWFLGGDWRYLNTDVSLKTGTILDDVLGGDVTVSGLGLIGHYEKLNSRMSPTKGFSALINGMWNDEAIGSDYDYNELKWELRQYFELGEKWNLSWRFDGATTDGDVPFFLEPFVQIEGIPALRYQGPTAATAELRGGYNFTPRWSAIAFGGGGRVGDNISDLGSAPSHTSVGAGFRYMLAKLLGIKVGLDVARGPEDTYVYLVVGSAWSSGL